MALAVAAGSLSAYLAVKARLRADVDDSLRERVAQIADVGVIRRRIGPPGRVGPGWLGGPEPGVAIPLPRGGESPRIHSQVVSVDGATTEPPGDLELPVDERVREIAAQGFGTHLRDARVDGVHLRVIAAPIAPGLAIQLARPLTEVDSLLGRLGLVLGIVAGAGVVTGAGLGWLVSGRALRPVRRFTEQTEAITAAPDLSQRIEVEGDDEIGRLARSFNATLDALERSVAAQRQLVADASHELRTPLASLRTNIEVLQRGDALPGQDREELLADLVAQTDELTNLVGDVVDIARRGESTEDFQEVRLDELTESVLARARRLAPQVRFEAELSPWVVRGAPERLERLVTNLVDNAIKWSPPGGVVEVRLREGVLSVRDHGPGFAEDDLPYVFERFYRSPDARKLPGSGLGLAIVRQVALAHGAAAVAENAEGGGARLRVTFPQAGE